MQEDFTQRFQTALKTLDKKKSEVVRQEEDDALVGVETIEEYTGEEKTSEPARLININLFQHPMAHPVILDMALLRKYGPEWMTWEYETLEWQIPRDFKTAAVSALNMGKIQAMKTLHFNDTFWQRWEVFNWCTAALNNTFADFEVLVPPSTAQIMVAIDIAGQVRADVEWTDEVKKFMVTVCRFDGIFCPPEPLSFLEVESANGLVDCAAIQQYWPDVRRTGQAPKNDTIVAEQLRRNLDVHNFLEASRKRMQDQLHLVLNV